MLYGLGEVWATFFIPVDLCRIFVFLHAIRVTTCLKIAVSVMLSVVETSPEYFCYLGGFFTAFSMTAEMKFEQVLKESLNMEKQTPIMLYGLYRMSAACTAAAR